MKFQPPLISSWEKCKLHEASIGMLFSIEPMSDLGLPKMSLIRGKKFIEIIEREIYLELESDLIYSYRFSYWQIYHLALMKTQNIVYSLEC